MVLVMVIVGFIILVLFCLIESLLKEDLHIKFCKIGDFTESTYSDFVKKIRSPNALHYRGNYMVANWWTENYTISLVFDKEGNFIYKESETFFQ